MLIDMDEESNYGLATDNREEYDHPPDLSEASERSIFFFIDGSEGIALTIHRCLLLILLLVLEATFTRFVKGPPLVYRAPSIGLPFEVLLLFVILVWGFVLPCPLVLLLLLFL